MCVEFENSHPRPLRVGYARSTRIHQGRQFSTRCSRIEWEIGRGEMSEWISQLNFTSFLFRSPITRQFYTRIRILCTAEVTEGWRNFQMTKQKVQAVKDVMSKHYLICTIVLMSSTLTWPKILLRLCNMFFEKASQDSSTWPDKLSPLHTQTHRYFTISLNFKRRIKSRLPFAGIIRSSRYYPRFQGKG